MKPAFLKGDVVRHSAGTEEYEIVEVPDRARYINSMITAVDPSQPDGGNHAYLYRKADYSDDYIFVATKLYMEEYFIRIH